jgi:hypothetical protein
VWSGLYHHVRIRGVKGALLWGYHQAATFNGWVIRKGADGQWILTATLKQGNAFQLRQRPLLFTAPREGTRDGFWAWGVESVHVGTTQVVAMLGPPEQ